MKERLSYIYYRHRIKIAIVVVPLLTLIFVNASKPPVIVRFEIGASERTGFKGQRLHITNTSRKTLYGIEIYSSTGMQRKVGSIDAISPSQTTTVIPVNGMVFGPIKISAYRYMLAKEFKQP